MKRPVRFGWLSLRPQAVFLAAETSVPDVDLFFRAASDPRTFLIK
jgi:hypothetical protein